MDHILSKTVFFASFLAATGLPLTSGAASSSQSWELQSEVDELTDASVTSAVINDRDGRPNTSLTVRCVKRKFEIVATFNAFLGNGLRPVKLRVDQGEVRQTNWFPSSKGTALFALDASSLARQLAAGSKLIIEATDFRGTGYRAAYAWPSGSDQVSTVMRACSVDPVGLESKVPGLRNEVAIELERWGPKYIITKKRALSSIAGFNGPIDASMTPEFALAAQAFADSYIDRCRKGELSGVHCDSLKIFWSAKMQPSLPPVGALIYEAAPKDLQAEMGPLKISD